MNKTQMRAFSSAIANAALSRRTALQIEIAVGFAVHLDVGQAKRATRALLCEIYAAAGYKSNKPGDIDWKAVNRRITATLALFDFVGPDTVAEWVDGKGQRQEMLDAISAKLAPMKLKSVNEVLEVCGKVTRAQRAAQAHRAHQVPPGAHEIETKHVHVVIPPNTSPAELMELALAIMALAQQETAAAAAAMAHAPVEEADQLETA